MVKIFGGVEGGGTASVLALVKEDGSILCTVDGPSTNHFVMGKDKCIQIICDMLKDGLQKAGLNSDVKLAALSLSLSGCEDETSNQDLEQKFINQHPEVAEVVVVCSDTIGSLFTGTSCGGVVLISGTGSNSLLVNPDGSTARCGGWGHMLGDEGGAAWISLKAVKSMFDAEDNFNVPKYDCTLAKKIILEYFKIKDKVSLLDHCYDFNKSFFAGLCVKLAEAAVDKKDPFCCDLFRRAGTDLGKYIRALKPKMSPDLLDVEGGVRIICIGQVFKSWELLKEGFIDGLDNCLESFTLLRLNVTAAVGAAYVGAKKSGYKLPLDFESSTNVLYSYKNAPKSV